MKKEVFIAIFVGLSMGLIITFGIYRVKTAVTTKPSTTIATQVSDSGETPEPTAITLHSPEEGLITSETDLTVTGTTIPNAFVVLFTNDTDQVSNSDDSGHFSFTTELSEGPNIIRVHVVNQETEVSVLDRLVVVSSVFDQPEIASESAQSATSSATKPENAQASKIALFDTQASNSAEQTSSNSGSLESLKDRIKKTLEQAKIKGVTDSLTSQKRAIAGEVTRVTDDSITLSRDGVTRILPLSDAVKITREKAVIKPTDIAIENWATVLGEFEGESFIPEYILVSTKTILPKTQKVFIGTVTKLTTTELTLLPRMQADEVAIKLVTATKYQDFEGKTAKRTDFSEDLATLVVSQETNDVLSATTVRSLAAFGR